MQRDVRRDAIMRYSVVEGLLTITHLHTLSWLSTRKVTFVIDRTVYAPPNLPTNIIPTKIAWLKLCRQFPMDMRIPPFKIKILLESNPPKSRILVPVRRLAACPCGRNDRHPAPARRRAEEHRHRDDPRQEGGLANKTLSTSLVAPDDYNVKSTIHSLTNTFKHHD